MTGSFLLGSLQRLLFFLQICLWHEFPCCIYPAGYKTTNWGVPLNPFPRSEASTNIQTGDEFPRNILCVIRYRMSANMFRFRNQRGNKQLSYPTPNLCPPRSSCLSIGEVDWVLVATDGGTIWCPKHFLNTHPQSAIRIWLTVHSWLQICE